MILLGIETSCDETAAGVVRDWQVLSNVLRTQAAHATFGGVVPEIASREHLRLLPGIVAQALGEAGVGLGDLDGIAFTRGPGLAGPLLVGASFARALALESGAPLWGVNHLEGHLAAVKLSQPDLEPPFLCLTVSGGHTEITMIDSDGSFRGLGATRDDAAGEAFDKTGKILGLGYPAGPELSRLAREGDPAAFAFPRGLRRDGSFDFSFSGLKSAVAREVERLGPETAQGRLQDLCASVQEAIVGILVEKTLEAAESERVSVVAVCGGVSANGRLREKLRQAGEGRGLEVLFPEVSLCTDNGTMIAGAALWRLETGRTGEMGWQVDPRLELGTA